MLVVALLHHLCFLSKCCAEAAGAPVPSSSSSSSTRAMMGRLWRQRDWGVAHSKTFKSMKSTDIIGRQVNLPGLPARARPPARVLLR